ncbi:MAG: carboxylesterase [Gammaproteobacteria bacterium]|nr:MAG: carboxylesterase [Gammaproteobacteria bacterium]
MKNTPPPLIIEPSSEVRSAVIWMHGLGADAYDFEGIISFLPTTACGIRMIFPNAPVRPVTINNGFMMRAWYDIADANLKNTDQTGIAESMASICGLIDEQIEAGIAAEKIVVAGFSQGGAIAVHTGLRYPKRLAGIMALSCYVLERQRHTAEINKHNTNTPIWMAHGTYDNVVPYALGESSAAFLSQNGHNITFISYPMAHEVCPAEITALSTWLTEVLG